MIRLFGRRLLPAISLGERVTLGLLLAVAAGSLVIIYAALFFSWNPFSNILLRLPGLDKVVHFLAGALLWLGVYWCCTRLLHGRLWRARRSLALVVSAAIVLADEFSQSLTLTRTVDWQDPISGLAGLLCALALTVDFPRAWKWSLSMVALSIVVLTVRSTYLRNHLFFEAMLLERQARYEEAYDRYRSALKTAPETAGVYNGVAWLCLEHLGRDFDKALEWAEIAVRLSPRNPMIRDTLGWAYYRNGELDRAFEELSAAAQGLPEDPEIRSHLEIVSAEIGNRASSDASQL